MRNIIIKEGYILQIQTIFTKMSNQQITDENKTNLTVKNLELQRENMKLKKKLVDSLAKMQKEIDKLKAENFALQKQFEEGKVNFASKYN